MSLLNVDFPNDEKSEFYGVLSNNLQKLTIKIPFDLLVCAGGSRSQMRDLYVGLALDQSTVAYFGVAVLQMNQLKAWTMPTYDEVTSTTTDLKTALHELNLNSIITRLPNTFQTIKVNG
ncbi:hypothetical protein Ddc_20055 [Ditylenchus destructor]|nr:hypothetical protein Ddc_20055 [Ditylenchus destructor]